MREFEYKYMLTSDIFEQLTNYYNLKNPVKQINHYFTDTEFTLRKKHATVRIREIDNKFYLQIKYELNDKHSFGVDCKNMSIREKYSREAKDVSDVNTTEIINITGIYIKDLTNVGCMTTYRYKYELNDNIVLCFDKNVYLGYCDYELEIEMKRFDSVIAYSILDDLGLKHPSKRQMGKCSRFMCRLNVIGKN